jgi:hypothetical protein
MPDVLEMLEHLVRYHDINTFVEPWEVRNFEIDIGRINTFGFCQTLLFFEHLDTAREAAENLLIAARRFAIPAAYVKEIQGVRRARTDTRQFADSKICQLAENLRTESGHFIMEKDIRSLGCPGGYPKSPTCGHSKLPHLE